MSLSEEFRANYGEIAQEVHEFVVLPGVKARFLGFRQAYRRPTEGLFHKDKNGEILLSDQYVWLGVVHDMCLPTFAISPEDAGDEITDETTDVLAGIIAPLSLGVLDGVEAEACLRGFLARVKDDLAEAEAQDAGTAAARAQGGAGGARGSVTHETPLPLGPRWYMMRPFKDRGRAMVVKPRMNPWDYHLDDDGAAVIRCWLPDFDPDHADLPGLEALLMTRFGVSPNNCQELTWPQIIGLLRVKGSTLPAEGPVGGPGEAAADSPRFTAVILPRDYKPSPSDDWSIPMSMAKIAQRLHLDRRTAQDFLAKTGLWQTSRQQWRVRLNTLTPTVRKKVTTEPKGDTE